MGILANSASKTHSSSVDDAVSTGYVTHERVTLSVSVSGTTYRWGLSCPSGSAEAMSRLSATDIASPSFLPDAPGYYVITCLVDTTTYILRLTVTSVGISQLAEVIRLSPLADAAVPAPAAGLSLYYSSTQASLCVKDPLGAVFKIDVTAA
jgi:hypothetical protein